MLGRHHDGVDADRAVLVVVLDGDLGLAVGAQVGQRAVLAHRAEPLGQPVGDRDRQRHQLRGVVAGVAEHQPLVAGALPVERVDRVVVPLLVGVVDALRDVGRLLRRWRSETPQERAVEALLAVVVADLEDPVAHELRRSARRPWW